MSAPGGPLSMPLNPHGDDMFIAKIRPTVLFFLFTGCICVFAQDEFEDVFEPKTTVGGYGELHYNYSQPDGGPSKEVLDFHRFVIYFGHAWSEKWSIRSELELEHNLVKDGHGILQLEQAFVNYYHAPYLSLQAGVLLVAAGFINEDHEPVQTGVGPQDIARDQHGHHHRHPFELARLLDAVAQAQHLFGVPLGVQDDDGTVGGLGENRAGLVDLRTVGRAERRSERSQSSQAI